MNYEFIHKKLSIWISIFLWLLFERIWLEGEMIQMTNEKVIWILMILIFFLLLWIFKSKYYWNDFRWMMMIPISKFSAQPITIIFLRLFKFFSVVFEKKKILDDTYCWIYTILRLTWWRQVDSHTHTHTRITILIVCKIFISYINSIHWTIPLPIPLIFFKMSRF